MSYHYLPIEQAKAGDIVEFNKPNYGSSFTHKKLYIVSKDYTRSYISLVEDDNNTPNSFPLEYFKLIKTKPGSEATFGDKCIRISGGKGNPCTPNGTIITVNGITTNKIHWAKYASNCCSQFLVLCQKPTKPKPQQPKEIPTMKLQDLINQIFGTTDYESKPNLLVVVYNAEGDEIATATADSIEDVTAKVQSNPKLWGCKLVTYKLHKEVTTEVPVTITKA